MSRQLSAVLPFLPQSGDEVVPYARIVAETAAARLWIGQSLHVEPHQALAYLAGKGLKVPVGTAVTLMPLRGPFEAALQARSLALLTGLPVIAGVGAGARRFVAAMRESGYESPLTAMTEYVSVMRALLGQNRHSFAGRYFQHRYPLPHVDHPPVSIAVGVLRPGMARVAGRVADAAITWLTPPGYLAEHLVPLVKAERDTKVIAQVGFTTGDPVHAALAAYGPHLHMPHYADMLAKAGIVVDLERPEATAEKLVEHGLVVTDRRALDDYFAAGADEVIVNVAGTRTLCGDEAALADLAAVLTAPASSRTR